MPNQAFTELNSVISKESSLLSKTDVPIITVSATYRKELIKKYKAFSRISSEVVYSRAHYSMAEAVKQAALKSNLSTHVVDPTNFVQTNDWSKIDFTEFIGQQIARNKPLQWLKGKIDTVMRSKLPITEAITPPLQSLISETTQPLIALHYEAGNIAIREGKKVLQVITDPHVRPQYLECLEQDNQIIRESDNQKISNNTDHLAIRLSNYPVIYSVFDDETKTELLQKARELGKVLDENQVVVTGPPVDPRISDLRKKRDWFDSNRPLQIGVTTGGLGTNLKEIKQILKHISPLLKEYPEKIRLFLYAGTHTDFRNFYESYAQDHNIRVGNLDDTQARIRVLYEDSIIDANENLIEHMFPWADAVITKPSGDMAYETIAAGAVPLFLDSWGEWEDNIAERLTKLKVAYDFDYNNADSRFIQRLITNKIQKAQSRIKKLPDTYFNGAVNIITAHQKMMTATPTL